MHFNKLPKGHSPTKVDIRIDLMLTSLLLIKLFWANYILHNILYHHNSHPKCSPVGGTSTLYLCHTYKPAITTYVLPTRSHIGIDKYSKENNGSAQGIVVRLSRSVWLLYTHMHVCVRRYEISMECLCRRSTTNTKQSFKII